jgi:bifunctional non-homologous end joining protein LigD
LTKVFSTTIQRPNHAAHVVTERPDTRFGGSYLFCDCAGWKFAQARGGCVHVQMARPMMEAERLTGALTPSQITAVEVAIELSDPPVRLDPEPERLGPITVPPRGVKTPISPMLAALTEPPSVGAGGQTIFPAHPFAQEGFVYEEKLDGHRLVLERRESGVVLWARSGRIVTGQYPLLLEHVQQIPVGTILDGEIVVKRDGVSSLSAFGKQRAMSREDLLATMRYAVFDVVQDRGVDCQREPYLDRKARLKEIVTADGGPMVEYVQEYPNGRYLWENVVVPFKLEGLIAKPVRSRYVQDERGTWLKIKQNVKSDFLVVGFTAGDGARADTFGAFVLAEREDDGSLRYSGKSGTGIKGLDSVNSIDRMRPRITTEPPFVKGELRRAMSHIGPRKVTWLRPGLVASVQYAERSDDNIPRFPSWQGWVADEASG